MDVSRQLNDVARHRRWISVVALGLTAALTAVGCSARGADGTLGSESVTARSPADVGLEEEVGSFELMGHGPYPDEPIEIWYHQPASGLATAPVLIVVPGRGRNAEEYRDDWLDTARRHDLVLLVPELPADTYNRQEYNLGNLVDGDGDVLPPEERTFAVIEALFSLIRSAGSGADGYYLYGHSAGAQFVHRLIMYTGDNRVLQAISANAGWYTMPDPTVEFPYGLRGGPPLDDRALAQMLAAPLTVLLGSDDDEPDASGLRRDDGASRQGESRLERGINFFAVGQDTAAQLDADFGWEIQVVEGAGHNNAEMVDAAAEILLG